MHHPNIFKIQLKMLPDAGIRLQETVPLQILQLEDTEFQKYNGEISFDFHISQPGETTALVRGNLFFTIESECALCLDHFTEKIEIPEICYYLENIESDCIDLTEYVREDILLALPMRSICSEECAGLCMQCGANLNKTTCNCQAETFEVEDEENESVWDIFDKLDLPKDNQ